MIRIARGAEPAELSLVRAEKLRALRDLGRPPTSNDIDGYRLVAENLWKAQHCKCCYCEQKITKRFNDVEHYRPKASADRRPGCSLNHGYWWLAFTWDNLLFACPACNRSAKNDKFPLAPGSTSLQQEDPTPGHESPLLLDPGSTTNPVEHIEFVWTTIGPAGSPPQWWARPRNQSQLGDFTIAVCDLNNTELLELRSDYFDTTIVSHVKAINNGIADTDQKLIAREFDRALELLKPKNPYVAFTYDALRFHIPNSTLQTAIQRSWPAPILVGL